MQLQSLIKGLHGPFGYIFVNMCVEKEKRWKGGSV